MLYHRARELAKAFGIKTSRWKRWAREFLPPDPLGGFQSGYGRQYSFKDVFTLIFAGHLVADLKFSVAAARKILADTRPWLKQAGFLAVSPATGLTGPKCPPYILHISSIIEAVGRPERLDFHYRIETNDSGKVFKSGNPCPASEAGFRPFAQGQLQATRTIYLSDLYRYCAAICEKLDWPD